MGQREDIVMRKQILALSKHPNVVVFRNNTGMAWQGEKVSFNGGILILRNARPVHFGLVKGGSDLIGLTTITITPEMVGQKVAVFTAIESKDVKGKADDDQLRFVKFVKDAGGFSGIAHNDEEAEKIVGY